MTIQILALAIGVLAPHSPEAGPTASCMRYERDSSVFRGRVVRRIFPGRPNYESIQRGDQPDTVYVLRLATPICMAASDVGEARQGVTEMQLYFSHEDEQAIKGMNGKAVEIPGTLEEWRLGWHYVPVLLHVRGLRRSRSAGRAV